MPKLHSISSENEIGMIKIMIKDEIIIIARDSTRDSGTRTRTRVSLKETIPLGVSYSKAWVISD